MIDQFIERAKQEFINRIRNQETIPMTVLNLNYDPKKSEHQVFVHEFGLREDIKNDEIMEVVKNCILGAEWESNEFGLENLCTIYGESRIKDGSPFLILQIKIGDKEVGEIHLFNKGVLVVNQDGMIMMDYEHTSYVCDLSKEE